MTIKTVSKRTLADQLPIPSFFDPKKVAEWAWLINFPARFKDAVAWREKHQIPAAGLDQKAGRRIALMPIDNQLTFCHPDFELYVGGRSGTGAIDDTRRLCEFVYRNLWHITRIAPTLDTHMAFQIFHAAFLVNDKGEHPDPATVTLVSVEDVERGIWRVDPAAAFAINNDPNTYMALQRHLLHYARSLKAQGKYTLAIWPFHAMLGSAGHALMPSLFEAIFFHTIARGSEPSWTTKGGNPLTEYYSVLRPEVLTGADGTPIGQRNVKFLSALLNHDAVVIAGQAKSHCVAWTIQDLLTELTDRGDAELVNKIYLLEDCTSSVVIPGGPDFTKEGDDAFKRFEQAGMHIVSSTTPISEWPGMNS